MQDLRKKAREPDGMDLRNGFYYSHCITCEKRLPKAAVPRRCDLCMKAITRRALEPTNAEPGSEEKIQVMAERAALGLPIFNRYDRTIYDNPPRRNGDLTPRRFASHDGDE